MKRGFGIVLALGVTTVVVMLLSAVQPLARAAASGRSDQYLSPSEVAFSPDGQLLYVVCERSDQLLVLSAKDGNVLQRVIVGHIPRAVAVSPDGRQAFVTNSWDDTVSVIDRECRHGSHAQPGRSRPAPNPLAWLSIKRARRSTLQTASATTFPSLTLLPALSESV